eukprot:g25641.t1
MKVLRPQDNLQRLILRNIPISAKPSEASYSPWDQNLIRLVNPVHPKYPAGFCSSFLVTDELGALRQRFRGFRFFLRPVRRDGEVQRALEVTALRGLAGTPWTQRSTARHPSDLDRREGLRPGAVSRGGGGDRVFVESKGSGGPEEIGAKADELVEFELGELKDLPPCHSVVTDRFEDWKERMATSYKRMQELIAANAANPKSQGPFVIPSHLVAKVMEEAMAEATGTHRGWIVGGFPTTLEEAAGFFAEMPPPDPNPPKKGKEAEAINLDDLKLKEPRGSLNR